MTDTNNSSHDEQRLTFDTDPEREWQDSDFEFLLTNERASTELYEITVDLTASFMLDIPRWGALRADCATCGIEYEAHLHTEQDTPHRFRNKYTSRFGEGAYYTGDDHYDYWHSQINLAAAVIEACNANGDDVSLLTEWMNVWVPRDYIFGDDRLWEDDRLIELFGAPRDEILTDPMLFVRLIASPSS